MGLVRTKEGVQFTVIAPGGFRILAAIDKVAKTSAFDLTITSACDGEHSGLEDPHHRGEAYDIRTHDLDSDIKQGVLAGIKNILGGAFYAFLEDPGTDNEHIHAQVRKGTVFP